MYICHFRKQLEVCYTTPRSGQCLFEPAWAVGLSNTTDIKPCGLSSTWLGSLSQQRTTLLFPLYSSSQPCNLGPLTNHDLWPRWIAALKTATKPGLCWSVVTLHRRLDRPACQSHSVCIVCCVYGIVRHPVYVLPWKPCDMSWPRTLIDRTEMSLWPLRKWWWT